MPGAAPMEHLAAEQLFVLRMLELSSRRSALVERRAQQSSSDKWVEVVKGVGTATGAKESGKCGASAALGVPEDEHIITGTVLLRKGNPAPEEGHNYPTYRLTGSRNGAAAAPAKNSSTEEGKPASPIRRSLDGLIVAPHRHHGNASNAGFEKAAMHAESPAEEEGAAVRQMCTCSSIPKEEEEECGDAGDAVGDKTGPHSPAGVKSFGAFLQHLCPPLNPLANTATAPMPTEACTTPFAAAIISPASSSLSGGASRAAGGKGELPGPSSSTRGELSTGIATSLLAPPPPYAAAPTPSIGRGAGTLSSTQEVLAHVRLLQRWSVAATRRWCSPASTGSGASPSDSNGGDAPPSMAQILALLSRRRPHGMYSNGSESSSSSSSSGGGGCCSLDTATAALNVAAAAVAAGFCDGEAMLVSDRVDALLPTWAYLTSHLADGAPASLFAALRATETSAEAGATATLSGRRRRGSGISSLSSSLTAGPSTAAVPALPPLVPTFTLRPGDCMDRQACLYPYELAEACALARLRRHRCSPQLSVSADVTRADGHRSALHLVRLELHMDVQPIPPTVPTISTEERQVLLDQALIDFAETGVMSTMVLRGVLNDAALRLLSSVDDDVLHCIACAGEEESVDDVKKAEGDTEKQKRGSSGAPSVRTKPSPTECTVVPLSLHVHTIQGELGPGATSPAAAAAKPSPLPIAQLPSPSGPSMGGISSLSGDTDSVRGLSGTTTTMIAAPVTPTQLVVTVLVHVTVAAVTQTLDSTTSPRSCSSSSPNEVSEEAEHTTNTEDKVQEDADISSAPKTTARELAQVVLTHLLPDLFTLSRYTSSVSVSSRVDFDALCSSSEVAAATTAVSSVDTPSLLAEPWTWVEVPVSALRASCAVPAPTSTPPAAIVIPVAPAEALAPRRHRAHRKAAVVSTTDAVPASAAAAAASAIAEPLPATVYLTSSIAKALGGEAKDQQAQQTTPVPEENTPQQRQGETVAAGPRLQKPTEVQEAVKGHEGGDNMSEETINSNEAPVLVDVARETAALTTLVEAAHDVMDKIGEHATEVRRVLDQMQCGEEAGASPGPLSPNTVDVASSSSAALELTAATVELQKCMSAVYTSAMALLTQEALMSGRHDERTGEEVAVAAERNLTSNEPQQTLHRLMSSSHGSGSGRKPRRSTSVATRADAPRPLIVHCLHQYADFICTELCGPLEAVEATLLDATCSIVTTPVTTNTSINVENSMDVALEEGRTTTIPSTWASSGAPRQVVGAQVVLKESRRQRRTAARRSGPTNTSADTIEVASVEEAVVLPALIQARTLLRRCEDLAGLFADISSSAAGLNTQRGTALLQPPSVVVTSGLDDLKSTASSANRNTRVSATAGVAQADSTAAHHRATSTAPLHPLRLVASAAAAQTVHTHVQTATARLTTVCRVLGEEESRWVRLANALPCVQAASRKREEAVLEAEAVTRRLMTAACASALAEVRAAQTSVVAAVLPETVKEETEVQEKVSADQRLALLPLAPPASVRPGTEQESVHRIITSVVSADRATRSTSFISERTQSPTSPSLPRSSPTTVLTSPKQPRQRQKAATAAQQPHTRSIRALSTKGGEAGGNGSSSVGSPVTSASPVVTSPTARVLAKAAALSQAATAAGGWQSLLGQHVDLVTIRQVAPFMLAITFLFLLSVLL